ncbi:MAG: hypothetical protein WC756_14055 [Taibaiella sp.]|jgi:hypothetical protein
MTDVNQFHDSFSDVPPPAKKLPDMLNVLTILTYIGCGVFSLSSVYSYFTICKSLEKMSQMGEDNPMASMMESMMDAMQKQCEMRLPVLIISLVSILLCFIGAMQMRKLKRTGFFIYLVGEVAGPVAMLLMVGGGGGIMATIGLVIPVVFIILYATQLKHLK